MVAKKFKNRCMVCGERVDKSAVADGAAYGTFTLVDDVSTDPEVWDGGRLHKRVLLCDTCALDTELFLRERALEHAEREGTMAAVERVKAMGHEFDRLPRGVKRD